MRILTSCFMLLILVGFEANAVTFLTEENPPLNFTVEGKLVGTSTAVVREMARRTALPAEIRVVA